jgi:hypothetical protein
MASSSSITPEHENIDGEQGDILVMKWGLFNLCGFVGMKFGSSPNGGTSGVGRTLGTQASLLRQRTFGHDVHIPKGRAHFKQCKVSLDSLFNSTKLCIVYFLHHVFCKVFYCWLTPNLLMVHAIDIYFDLFVTTMFETPNPLYKGNWLVE